MMLNTFSLAGYSLPKAMLLVLFHLLSLLSTQLLYYFSFISIHL